GRCQQDASARRVWLGHSRARDRRRAGTHGRIDPRRLDRRIGRHPRLLRHVEGHPAGDAGHARDERRRRARLARCRRHLDPASRCRLVPLMKAAALALLVTAGLAAAQTNPDRKFIYTGQAMGTVVTVFIWGDDEVKAAKAAEDVFKEMKRIDGVMTTWTPDSEVSQ